MTPDLPDDDDDDPPVTYVDAPASVIAVWMRRRKRMSFVEGEGLPPLDADLDALMANRIPANEPPPTQRISLHGHKLRDMRAELAGKPELAALNAILIAHLRKQSFPAHAPALFLRIWTEKGAELLPELPTRWLISSIITFADHGENEMQRRIGQSLNVLFSLMKLYETERLFSGADPKQAAVMKATAKRRLPMDMRNFALLDGDLDYNLLAPLWKMARSEPVAGPLAWHLLHLLNKDPANLFRRIGILRARRQLQKIDAAMETGDASDGDDRKS